jgi:predicted nucleic acid-binding protein
MSKVFADTFYFLALLNKNDEAHEKAVAYSANINKLVTTEWVLTELADGLASSRHRNMFLQTRQELLADGDVQVIPLDRQIHEEGILLYAGRPDKQWSLTDCISFVVMQHEGVTEALTGDHHFEQAGFVALLKP